MDRRLRRFARRFRGTLRRGGPPPWMVTILAGLLVAALAVGALEARLRPMVVTAAQAQTQNQMNRVVEDAVWRQLEESGVAMPTW